DVVVLVVAADDGVMPQTIEAINHAKAADVPIVVALNKIDRGEQNKLKIYGQLSEQGLTPSGEWGGEIDVIPTSATTGAGVDDLIEHLADLSAVLELKADPTLPACGTVIEAETKPGVGAVIRLLVQEGTLRVGNFVVCGPAFGKVRALLDDRGARIQEAGPAQPVEVWGLDDVPAAGDKLYAVDDLSRAKSIATETKQARVAGARVRSRRVKTLQEMFDRRDSEEVPELNVIIKTDVDGSGTALRQALGRPITDEVKLTIRHSGVGTVTDSDVLLAAACGGIIIAFRVDPSTGVRRLAERHGVDIRSYRVIYDVCDDLKKALEGLLAPEERIEPRATLVVRQMFNFGKKIGIVAGTMVTDGLVNRKQFAKIVRDGVVVRDRCKFQSLRRFKDDVKEVRAGMECGIRLEGFDDIHVGDRIETYEIVEIARTL
ncbi:MAG: translation initiation factor IF-2, partial [Planctomycetes bacterium]|nr:translation initiation factor IF-2 [Planctomycetota bacterium]